MSAPMSGLLESGHGWAIYEYGRAKSWNAGKVDHFGKLTAMLGALLVTPSGEIFHHGGICRKDLNRSSLRF
jgi:hypothetical protein